MTEVLYCPKRNECFLFEKRFEYCAKTNTIIAYLMSDLKRDVKINIKDLVHIGWL